MEIELSMDNILDLEDVNNLFNEDSDHEDTNPEQETKETSTEKVEEKEKEKENKEFTEVNPDDLFKEKPESVGNGNKDNIEEKEDTKSEKQSDSSNTNFYSSIAKALHEDGVFPDLNLDDLSKVSTPEELSQMIENQLQAKLDDRQKRIDEALNVGIEPSAIKQYEDTISYLDNLEEAKLNAENEQGEALRKNLIYQDYLNRGYSKERAEREVNKSFNAGTDVDDAKEALKSNKEFFTSEYQNLVEEAKAEETKFKEAREQQAEQLKKSILEDSKVFGDIEIDKSTRQRVYENISKPIYKDPKSGDLYTAIQKYQKENTNDFIKNVGLLYTLTDGFKNIDKIVKPKVNKELKKGLRNLEHTINTTSRNADGSLNFVSGVNDDPESFIGKWDIDA